MPGAKRRLRPRPMTRKSALAFASAYTVLPVGWLFFALFTALPRVLVWIDVVVAAVFAANAVYYWAAYVRARHAPQ